MVNTNFVGTHFIADATTPTQQLKVNSDGSINTIVTGGASGGTASQYGQAFPAFGTAVGFLDSTGTIMSAGNLDASGNIKVVANIGESVLNVTGNATSATTLSNFPVNPTTGYRSAAVQVTSAGVTCTLVAEESNDGTTWTGLQSLTDTTVESPTPMTAIGMYVFNFTGLRFRIRCSVYGSGTPAVNAELRQNPVTASEAALLQQIYTALVAALPAGTNLIGKVGIDQTTPGTTNLVAAGQNGTWTVGISASQTIGVTQATAANLNATVVGVWQGATGSNVPANATATGLRGTTANPAAVTDGQLVGAQGDKEGRTVVVPYAVRDLVAQQKTEISNSTSETTIVTAIASTFLDILSFNFSNSGATATKVDIRDTTGGSIVATFMVPAGDMRGQTYTLPFKQTTVNTNWTAQCAAATTAMEITVQYVKNI